MPYDIISFAIDFLFCHFIYLNKAFQIQLPIPKQTLSKSALTSISNIRYFQNYFSSVMCLNFQKHLPRKVSSNFYKTIYVFTPVSHRGSQREWITTFLASSIHPYILSNTAQTVYFQQLIILLQNLKIQDEINVYPHGIFTNVNYVSVYIALLWALVNIIKLTARLLLRPFENKHGAQYGKQSSFSYFCLI